MANDMVLVQGMKMKIIDNGDGTFSFAAGIGVSSTVLTQGIAMSRIGSAVVGSSLVIKAGAGTLYGLSVYNTGAVDQYIQIHNTTTLPADTAVPIITIPLYAGGVLFLDYGVYGIPFAVGMVACNSTTIGTKTIGAADCWFVATYK